MSDTEQHWNSIYQAKATEQFSWFQDTPNCSLDMVKRLNLSPNAAIIDVGSGDSLLADHLIADGYEDLTLVDISNVAIKRSKLRLHKFQERITWVTEDILYYSGPKKFALWHDRAAFHFLITKQEKTQYVKQLKQHLLAGAHIILATFAIDGAKKCSGLPIEQYNELKLTETLGPEFQLVSTLSHSHKTPTGAIQRFMYFTLQYISSK